VLEDAQQRAPATANWQEIFAALCVDPETPLPGEEGVSGSPQAA